MQDMRSRTRVHYRAVWTMLRDAYFAWNEHEAPRLGAALAFYTILSLAPLVILVIAIAALTFGNSAAQGQLLAQIDGLIGRQGSDAVKAMIEHAQKPASGAFTSIAGVIALLFGASGETSLRAQRHMGRKGRRRG